MCADNGNVRLDWMYTLAGILRCRPSAEHLWHLREQNRYELHAAVREAVTLSAPADWHKLVLEWPHVAQGDPNRLAYTRSNDHGIADRQTVTTINKYISANFPALKDHHIRDICAKYGAHEFKISRDMEEMLELLSKSPSSCMVNRNWSKGEWHPYRAYSPAYGWGLAVRIQNGLPMARALVNDNSKTFVRSFGAQENDRNHSQNDDALNSWLMSQGYEYVDSWAGLKLAIVDHPHSRGFTAPYIDGDAQSVDNNGDHLLICEDGEYECTNTDGTYSGGGGNYCDCDECGREIDVDDDNYYWAGRHEDHRICQVCYEEEFVHAIGENGVEYLAHINNCTWVESCDQHYVNRYMESNNIVYLDDIGEYDHVDHAVYLENAGKWVSQDCEYAVFCEHSQTWEHIDDCTADDDGDYILTSDLEEKQEAA